MKKFIGLSAIVFLTNAHALAPLPKKIIDALGITLNEHIPFVQELNHLGVTSRSGYSIISLGAENLPLFQHFPELANKVSYISFADLPTPVQELTELNSQLHNPCGALYIKRDDLTGTLTDGQKLYGGNKVRKLEFLLPDARACGAQEVITFGCAGSNHALATAVYANQLGMQCANLLKPQINSHVVQQNLLLAKNAHADLLYFPDNDTRKIGAFAQWMQKYQSKGTYPYIIPTGGSCPIGVLGFVNAACELKQQILHKQITLPDYIYVATGSCGTVAGLALGFELAHIKTHIIAVATEPHESNAAYLKELEDLYTQTNQFLHEKDTSVPLRAFPQDRVTIRFEFSGNNYGMPTAEGQQAQALFKKHAGINLDPTYTAKAAAALIADAHAGMLTDKVVLYWDTYCGLDFSDITATVNYQDLPVCFHEYFE